MRVFRTFAFLVLAGVAASAANAQRPHLLKRHGVIYGVRGLDYFADCRGMPAMDACEVFKLSGTVVAVESDRETNQIESLTLRTRRGRNIDLDVLRGSFPAAARNLIRLGRHVRVSGTITGQGRVMNTNQIIAEDTR